MASADPAYRGYLGSGISQPREPARREGRMPVLDPGGVSGPRGLRSLGVEDARYQLVPLQPPFPAPPLVEHERVLVPSESFVIVKVFPDFDLAVTS